MRLAKVSSMRITPVASVAVASLSCALLTASCIQSAETGSDASEGKASYEPETVASRDESDAANPWGDAASAAPDGSSASELNGSMAAIGSHIECASC